MKGSVTSTVDIKLTSSVGIKLMLHIDIYVTIQLDVNVMLPNLMYVHEINTRKVIFLAISIHHHVIVFCISESNYMDFYSIDIIIIN